MQLEQIDPGNGLLHLSALQLVAVGCAIGEPPNEARLNMRIPSTENWLSVVAAVIGFLNELISARDQDVRQPCVRQGSRSAFGQSKSPTLDIDGLICPMPAVEDVARPWKDEGSLFDSNARSNSFSLFHAD